MNGKHNLGGRDEDLKDDFLYYICLRTASSYALVEDS